MENKWWEYYTVRYFVGTVVGAVIVGIFNAHCDSPFKDSLVMFVDFKESKFLGVSLIAALGFAFCYIASSPVLILHATRAHLRFSTLKTHWRSHAGALTLSIGATVWSAWQVLPPIAASGIGVVIGGQVGLIILALLALFKKDISPVESFYRELAKVRAEGMVEKDKPPTARLEYITSYRHLREHGNAFTIVILEMLLAYALYQLHSDTYAFWLIAAWLLPATASWILGTILECRNVSTPLEVPKK